MRGKSLAAGNSADLIMWRVLLTRPTEALRDKDIFRLLQLLGISGGASRKRKASAFRIETTVCGIAADGARCRRLNPIASNLRIE